MSLLETWLSTYTDNGQTQADALRDLNEQLGTVYESGNVSRWRRRLQTPDPEVMDAMVRRTMPFVLQGYSQINAKAVRKAIKSLLWYNEEEEA